MTKLQFRLTRAARGVGGDRYECNEVDGEDTMTIYIPQSISRAGSKIMDRVEVTIKEAKE